MNSPPQTDPIIEFMIEVISESYENSSHEERGELLDFLLERAREIYPMKVDAND